MNTRTNQQQKSDVYVQASPRYNSGTGQLILPAQPSQPGQPTTHAARGYQAPAFTTQARISPPLARRSRYPFRRMIVFTLLSIFLAAFGSLSIGRQIFPASALMQKGPGTNTITRPVKTTKQTPTAQPSAIASPSPTVSSPTPGTTPTTSGATPVATAPVATTMPVTGSSSILLMQDTFSRGDQRFWGITSSGQAWQGDAANNANFSIQRQEGVIANGSGYYNALLGPQLGNVSVVFSGLITSFDTASLGAVLRWQDSNNWYKAYIDGTQVLIVKRVHGQSSTLATVPFPALANIPYTMRFSALGSMLQVRVWPAGTVEPTRWLLTAMDTSLTKGVTGIRVEMQPGVEAFFLSFSDYTIVKGQ